MKWTGIEHSKKQQEELNDKTKQKSLNKGRFVYLYFLVFLLVVAVGYVGLKVLRKTPMVNEPIQIYREGDKIYAQGNVLIDDVVDYTLTSLDGKGQHLLVIHSDRSEHVDEEGYDMGVKEGHNIGGYVRFYQVVFDTIQQKNKSNVNENVIVLKMIYENDFTYVNPWCIEAAHMEEDGQLDIFIGAYRATKVYPFDRRPFLFHWTGEQLERQWTGSYINMRTFYEAGFEDCDEDGYSELYLVQSNDSGDGLVKYFYKKGYFTFEAVKEEKVPQ